MGYDSIENKPAVDKSADTPELKKEVIDRILDVWLVNPSKRFYDLITDITPPRGFPKPLEDRDFIHLLENYYNSKKVY